MRCYSPCLQIKTTLGFQPAQIGIAMKTPLQRKSVVCFLCLNNNPKYFFMKAYHEYRSCIDACLQCAAICNHCASSCTQEEDVKAMAQCIYLDMQCAAVCYAAAQLMSMGSNKAGELCSICAEICEACGNECGKHDMEHCRECAEACHRCAEECRTMAGIAA
jgi:hypothetical protein